MDVETSLKLGIEQPLDSDLFKREIYFSRVSGDTQSLDLQDSCMKPMLEKLEPHEYMIISEGALSNNKTSLNNRPKMLELFNLIKNNRVKRIVAYDPARFFRDTYEGNYLLDLVLKHNVEIHYTGTNRTFSPTRDSFALESFMFMAADAEGKNIARRTAEAKKRYPNELRGYINLTEEKRYIKDETKKESIEELFRVIKDVNCLEDFISHAYVYVKKIGWSGYEGCKSLCDMLTNPFYSAHVIDTDSYHLSYVEHYITLDEFQENQSRLGEIIKGYLRKLEDTKSDPPFTVSCGICKKTLKSSIDYSTLSRRYSCNNKHKRVAYSESELEPSLIKVIEEVIKNINPTVMQQDVTRFYQRIQNFVIAEEKMLSFQIKKLEEKIVFQSIYPLTATKETEDYRKRKKLIIQYGQMLDKFIGAKAEHEYSQTVFVLLQDALRKKKVTSLNKLIEAFIDDVIIQPGFIDVVINSSDYISNLPIEFVIEREEDVR